MTPRPNCIATSLGILLVAVCLCSGARAAEPVGTVLRQSGTLVVKRADGRAKVLGQESSIDRGDLLFTGAESYARIRLDGANDLVLEPQTELTVNGPSEFVLQKGGLRGSGHFSVRTASATVEVEGTAIAELAGDLAVSAREPVRIAWLQTQTATDAPTLLAQSLPGGASAASGLYVHVLDGVVHLTNSGGSQSFSAGQFGYTPSLVKPPVVVPSNPGIKFTPPPAFSVPTSTKTGAKTGAATVDCEVR